MERAPVRNRYQSKNAELFVFGDNQRQGLRYVAKRKATPRAHREKEPTKKKSTASTKVPAHGAQTAGLGKSQIQVQKKKARRKSQTKKKQNRTKRGPRTGPRTFGFPGKEVIGNQKKKMGGKDKGDENHTRTKKTSVKPIVGKAQALKNER